MNLLFFRLRLTKTVRWFVMVKAMAPPRLLVSGGNAPYSILGQKCFTSASANDLAARLHTITITDDKGC
ncbi:MAG: hypothetical protein IPF54_18965, partial [Draconibacterium sp.]|nr:hypothetical protein [Draconibacterium sp.]